MIKGITYAHLRPIWYLSEPSDVPSSPNQSLGWDFFCHFLQQTGSSCQPLGIVRPNSTRFLGLNSNLDPIFGFNRVGLGPQDKKTGWIGSGWPKNWYKFEFKSNMYLINPILGRALRVQIWVKSGRFGPHARVNNSGQIWVGLVRFIWPHYPGWYIFSEKLEYKIRNYLTLLWLLPSINAVLVIQREEEGSVAAPVLYTVSL